MNDPPHVVVVILNWNGERDTIEAAESVEHLDYPNLTTLVVDNGSLPRSLERIRQALGQAEVVETGRAKTFRLLTQIAFLEEKTEHMLFQNRETRRVYR